MNPFAMYRILLNTSYDIFILREDLSSLRQGVCKQPFLYKILLRADPGRTIF